MATLSDISVSLIEGRKDTYHKEFIPALTEALKPDSIQADGEYLQECPDFDIRDALAVSERHPGLLVELDVKGEYEEDSCRVRLRGGDHELIQKQYPRFEKLLSSREGAASDSHFFSHFDLEQADRRALAYLHTHIKKDIAINYDLPGNELVLVFRNADDQCFAIDVQTVTLEGGIVRFRGIDPATGFKISANEHILATGQAIIAAQYISQEI